MHPDEVAFTARLKAHPEDETARLIFADWLEEHGRAAEATTQRAAARGYRAWVVTGRKCWNIKISPHQCPYISHDYTGNWSRHPRTLPDDWFDLIEMRGKQDGDCPSWMKRRDATEDEIILACAIAFGKLPVARQDEILAMFPQPEPEMVA